MNMPKKDKKMPKNAWQPATRSSNGEVYRNFFAVRDGLDPRVSLRSIKEMFIGKVDPDVVTMIFTECAYDVDQTVETLISLSSEKNLSSSTDIKSNLDCLDDFELNQSENSSIVNSQSSFSECIKNETFVEKGINVSDSLPNPILSNSGSSSNLYVESNSSLCTIQTTMDEIKLPYIEKTIITSTRTSHSSSSNQGKSSISTNSLGIVNGLSFSHIVTPQYITPVASFHTMKTHQSKNFSNEPPQQLAKNNTSNIYNKENSGRSNVNDISSKIIDGQPLLVLLRGLPGSGKSTLAKEIKFSGVVLSTDDYFEKNGKYRFDFRKLTEAHAWNRERAKKALARRVTPVIIDNTNTEAWEMLPYVKLAVDFQYEIHILEPNNPWKFKPWKLARKNSHNVPKENIERMLIRYDHSVTVDSLKRNFQSESCNKEKTKESKESQPPEGNSSDIASTNSDSSENVNEGDSNCISLEAVIHREDNDDDSSSVPPNDEDLSNQDSSQDISDKTGDSKVSCQERIEDLSQLKLLVLNERDEEDPSPISNHELPAWETIMEHDDDFSWSAPIHKGHTIGLITLREDESLGSNASDWSSGDTPSGFTNKSFELPPDSLPKPLEDSVLETCLPNEGNNLINFSTDSSLPDGLNGDKKCNIEIGNQISLDQTTLKSSFSKPQRSIGLFTKFSQSKAFDWEMPSFKDDAKADVYIPEVKEKEPCYDAEVQTEPSDFVLLHKIENNPLFITEFTTLVSRPLPSQDQNFTTMGLDTFTIPLVPHFDKSTSTSDMVEDTKLEQMDLLQQCFPEICYEDLKNLLDVCHGDSTWLSNILLEWGYKYNVPGENYSSEPNSSHCAIESYDLLPVKNINSTTMNELDIFDYNECYGKPETKFSFTWGSKQQSLTAENFQETKNESFNGADQDCKSDEKISSFDNQPLFNLILNPALLSYLQEKFGPISKCHPENLPDDLRTLPVDDNFAKMLYDHWKNSFKAAGGKLLDSCEQQDRPTVTEQLIKPEQSVEYLSSDMKERILSGVKEPLSLSEIMDMEYALQVSRQEILKKKINQKEDVSVKLVRLQLHQMFPGVDPLALDEVFDSNNCSLKNTLIALEADIGKPAKITSNEKVSLDRSNKSSTSDKDVIGDWKTWVEGGGGGEESFVEEEFESHFHNRNNNPYLTPEAAHWRAEAVMHYQSRQICINKAKSAFHRGMRSVASYYAQEGDYHSMQFKEANARAAKLIFHNKNNNVDSKVLDLHGLYIQEAIPILSKFLRSNKEKLDSGSSSESVRVITGRGVHSSNGASKLRTSVMKYLTNNGHRFDETKIGLFNVTLSASS